MKRKKSLPEVVSSIVLLMAIVIIFHWYTMENTMRIEERNKNYAADSAWKMAAEFQDNILRWHRV